MSKTAFYNGAEVVVVSVTGGWTTITDNGVTKKVRNGALSSKAPEAATAATPEPAAPATAEPAPATNPNEAGETKMAKSKAKAKKAPKVAKANGDGRLIKADLTKYVKAEGKDRKVLDVADTAAKKLRDLSLSEQYEFVAKQTGESMASLKAKYGKLNPGMQRMNLGNKLRGAMAASK